MLNLLLSSFSKICIWVHVFSSLEATVPSYLILYFFSYYGNAFLYNLEYMEHIRKNLLYSFVC